jgi:hypothetical protein
MRRRDFMMMLGATTGAYPLRDVHNSRRRSPASAGYGADDRRAIRLKPQGFAKGSRSSAISRAKTSSSTTASATAPLPIALRSRRPNSYGSRRMSSSHSVPPHSAPSRMSPRLFPSSR